VTVSAKRLLVIRTDSARAWTWRQGTECVNDLGEAVSLNVGPVSAEPLQDEEPLRPVDRKREAMVAVGLALPRLARKLLYDAHRNVIVNALHKGHVCMRVISSCGVIAFLVIVEDPSAVFAPKYSAIVVGGVRDDSHRKSVIPALRLVDSLGRCGHKFTVPARRPVREIAAGMPVEPQEAITKVVRQSVSPSRNGGIAVVPPGVR